MIFTKALCIKIQTIGADVSERDAISGAFKNFMPPHFRPQPAATVNRAQPPNNIVAAPQIKSDVKGQKPYKRIVPQAPQIAASETIDVKRPIDTALKEVEALCSTLHTVQDIIDAVKNYKSDTEWQKLAASTIFFDGDHDPDILFIGDIPSKEDEQFGKPLSGSADHILKETMKYVSESNIKIARANLLFGAA